MEKGKIIMICGLPGAGKTTLAKKLEKELPAVRLCPDEWIPPLLEDPDDMKEAKRLREPVEKLLLELAIRLAKLGNDVVIENGFWTIKDRDKYKNQLKEAGLRIELYCLEAPIEVLWERIKKRNKEIYPFKIKRDYLEKWYKVFQPVSEEEAKDYEFYEKINS